MFGFTSSVTLMAVGYSIIGLLDVFMIVYSLSELIEIVENVYPKMTPVQKFKMADFSSIFITIMFGIGQVLAPILGSILESNYGYRTTCDIVATACLVLGLSYLIIAGGFHSLCRTLKNIC